MFNGRGTAASTEEGSGGLVEIITGLSHRNQSCKERTCGARGDGGVEGGRGEAYRSRGAFDGRAAAAAAAASAEGGGSSIGEDGWRMAWDEGAEMARITLAGSFGGRCRVAAEG